MKILLFLLMMPVVCFGQDKEEIPNYIFGNYYELKEDWRSLKYSDDPESRFAERILVFKSDNTFQYVSGDGEILCFGDLEYVKKAPCGEYCHIINTKFKGGNQLEWKVDPFFKGNVEIGGSYPGLSLSQPREERWFHYEKSKSRDSLLGF